MKTLKLNDDYEMPMVGLGTWKSKPGEVYQAIRWAIKFGYQHIDCAPIYGNQAEIGQAIHDAVKEGDIKREKLFVTSKLWNDSHAPEDVRPALEQTLKDLQLEYLDLFLMHWPVAQKKGITMPENDGDMVSLKDLPLEMTWAAMEKVQQEGLAKVIGVSNFSASKISSLLEKAEILPAVNQIEIHPLLQQNDLIDFCHKNNVAVTAYSPLGSNDSHSNNNEPRVMDNDVVKEIAERLSIEPSQVLLAWAMTRGLAVIPKSTKFDHIQGNFDAQSIVLDAEDMAKIAALDKNYRYIKGDVFARGDYTVENIWA